MAVPLVGGGHLASPADPSRVVGPTELAWSGDGYSR